MYLQHANHMGMVFAILAYLMLVQSPHNTEDRMGQNPIFEDV